MNLADRIAAVRAAEADCLTWRGRIEETRAQLSGEFRRSATPGRIVVSGLALGFAFGLKPPSDGQPSLAGKVLGGPVFSMVLEAVLPGLLAGLTAAAGLQATDGEADEDAADDGDVDAERQEPVG